MPDPILQEFIKRVYERTGALPEIIFYDNNCRLLQVLKNDPFFKNTKFPVDVFHFNCKHSAKDVFCQENCNPANYPELHGTNGGWYFNSSAAEQTNNWLGKFQAIGKEMTAVKSNFFFDEMIICQNHSTLTKLTQAGAHPASRADWL